VDDDNLFDDFLNEIRKEVNYHSEGGTSYRQKTSELSLVVASKVGRITPFFDRKNARQIVIGMVPDADKNEVEDVTKMLQVVARELKRKATLPESIKDYIDQKRRNRKPIRFKRRDYEE
jgi:hypothetical protein